MRSIPTFSEQDFCFHTNMASEIRDIDALAADYEKLCLLLKSVQDENVLLKEHLTMSLHTIEKLSDARKKDIATIEEFVAKQQRAKKSSRGLQNTLLLVFVATLLVVGAAVWYSK